VIAGHLIASHLVGEGALTMGYAAEQTCPMVRRSLSEWRDAADRTPATSSADPSHAGGDAAQLLRAADRALRIAKGCGGNCVALADVQTSGESAKPTTPAD